MAGAGIGAAIAAGVLAVLLLAERYDVADWWFADRDVPASARRIDVRPIEHAPAHGLALPKKPGSLRFAVLGDAGRGDAAQFQTAAELTRWHDEFPFEFVLLLGDNIYGPGTPEDYVLRFERPYAALLDAGVEFHAAIGNHDPPDEPNYPPFGMQGHRYYAFEKSSGVLKAIAPTRVQFFAIDTVTIDRDELDWLRRELAASTADWQICFYHHPVYTSGRYPRDAARTRRALEALFVRYGVDVGLSGHEHLYERVVPMSGVQYFTSGAGGALRRNDLHPSAITAAGFDADTHFLLFEIAGDELYFQAVSRTGDTIDSGHFTRAPDPAPPPSIRR